LAELGNIIEFWGKIKNLFEKNDEKLNIDPCNLVLNITTKGNILTPLQDKYEVKYIDPCNLVLNITTKGNILTPEILSSE